MPGCFLVASCVCYALVFSAQSTSEDFCLSTCPPLSFLLSLLPFLDFNNTSFQILCVGHLLLCFLCEFSLKQALVSHNFLQFRDPLFLATRDQTWWGKQVIMVRTLKKCFLHFALFKLKPPMHRVQKRTESENPY